MGRRDMLTSGAESDQYLGGQVNPEPNMSTDPVAFVIEARPRDLGGFGVRRALPAGRRRMVGPFIFFDHIGPEPDAARAAASTSGLTRTSRWRR